MTYLIRISILFAASFLFIQCAEHTKQTVLPDRKEEQPRGYRPTVLDQDTTTLWIGSGDISVDTVLIVGEGGPKNNLDFEANGRVYWEYLPNQQNYYFAVIHQSSTYNKSILGADNFTIADATFEVNISSEIMYRTIKYFKDRGKYVVVFGHSYSAFIIPHYLMSRPSLADKYVITGGRLEANESQTAFQLKGINTGFKEDGKTLIIPDENEPKNPNRTKRYESIRATKEKLKYAIGFPRYLELLKGKDLSNLVFYFGKKDQNVGALSSSELEFLQANGATVAGVDTDHYNIWKRVVDAFREGRLNL